jgi:hypothetical protein
MLSSASCPRDEAACPLKTGKLLLALINQMSVVCHEYLVSSAFKLVINYGRNLYGNYKVQLKLQDFFRRSNMQAGSVGGESTNSATLLL